MSRFFLGNFTLFSWKFVGHVLRIYVCASKFFFDFDYSDYGFSPKILFTTLLSMDCLLYTSPSPRD